MALSPTPLAHGPQAGQISPNKNMNCQCATAAFTLSPVPGGLCHLVLTRPETGPSMRFLSVGSHLCARASFRPPLTRLPLPSASSCICPTIGHYRYSYRGPSPHKFMPMSGVHHDQGPGPAVFIGSASYEPSSKRTISNRGDQFDFSVGPPGRQACGLAARYSQSDIRQRAGGR